jgi:L-aspartate oxidase
VLSLGEDEKRMRFIYSKTELVLDLLKELDINFVYRSFGIIPLSKERGGKIILERLQKHIPLIHTDTELINFTKNNGKFEVCFKRNCEIFQIKSKYLVLATGGYGGIFKLTNNFHYKNYRVFKLVKKNGGEIINLDCIFYHPFGYKEGREILTGEEVKFGEFIDSKDNFIFDKRTRQLIKNNNYHEIFWQLLKEIKIAKKSSKVYFISSEIKTEISPTVHYTSGGIKTNYLGEVIGCKNLFAIGECRADGSRNGGRLPGYPFTSAIVDGKILGKKIAHFLKKVA